MESEHKVEQEIWTENEDMSEESLQDLYGLSEYKPFDSLLYACSNFLLELSESIWLYNLPSYERLTKRTEVKFHGKKKTHRFACLIFAAFKYHIENITRIGKIIFLLRKTLVWIELIENELMKSSNIFNIGIDLMDLANKLQSNLNSTRKCLKTIQKLGSVTIRLSLPNQEKRFQVRALVSMDEKKCQLEAYKRYTVVKNSNPFLWQLEGSDTLVPSIFLDAEVNGLEKKLCERVYKQLKALQQTSLLKIRKSMIAMLNNKEDINFKKCKNGLHVPPIFSYSEDPSRDKIYFAYRAIPKVKNKPLSANPSKTLDLPELLRTQICMWLDDTSSGPVWSIVDKFESWMERYKGEPLPIIKQIRTSLHFIQSTLEHEYENVNDLDESGFVELNEMGEFGTSSIGNNFLSWNMKIENSLEKYKKFSWEGNLHLLDKPSKIIPFESFMFDIKQYLRNMIQCAD